MSVAAPVTFPPIPDTASSFYRPCWAEISEQALRSNWRALRQKLKKGVEMMAVVKANGYGLGLATAAEVAVSEGAAYLGVTSVDEGIALRELGHHTPILILGSLYPFESFSLLFKHHLTPTVASLEAALALDKMARKNHERFPVHLKVDCGFGRIGVSLSTAPAFIQLVAGMEGLLIEGIYTHFASSDVDADGTRQQAKAFLSVVEAAQSQGVNPRWIHLANSSAILRFPETHGTMVRPGLGYYGIPPYEGASKSAELAPALSLKSRIIFLKTVPKGSSISYAKTWTAKRPTRVATLAIGYADGLPRILSNKGNVLIGGRRAPILGRVTMDMTMVEVTDIPDVRVGDEAVVIGKQGKEEITAGEVAEQAQTNAYEILCGIGSRVPRVVTHE